MASKLATLLAAPSADEDDNPNEDAVTWCDHKLQEVREVVALIAKGNFNQPDVIARARTLMEKLEVR